MICASVVTWIMAAITATVGFVVGVKVGWHGRKFAAREKAHREAAEAYWGSNK